MIHSLENKNILQLLEDHAKRAVRVRLIPIVSLQRYFRETLRELLNMSKVLLEQVIDSIVLYYTPLV